MRLCSLLTERSSHWQSFGLDGHEADTSIFIARHQESEVMRARKKVGSPVDVQHVAEVNAKNGSKAQNAWSSASAKKTS